MGWNDSRINLVAPGWRMVLEQTLTPQGQSLGMLGEVREENAPSQPLRAENVVSWLEERGFKRENPTPKYLVFRKDEVEVFPVIEEGELASLCLTFQLSKQAPTRWEAWQEFIDFLCKTWNLAPFDYREGKKVEPEESLRLLAETQAWQEFAKNFGWPPVARTPIKNGILASGNGITVR